MTRDRNQPILLRCLSLAVFALGLVSPGHSFAAEQAADSQVRHRFATVWRLSGTLSSSFGEAANAHPLKVGDAIYVGDRLEAAAGSDAVLQTEDAAYVAMRAGAHFSVDQYVAEKKDTDRFTLRLLQGSLRLISGWVAKLHPQAYRIITPTATVGIRGTDHETYVLTDELAQSMGQTAGTYDKVNSGGTALTTSGGSVGIDPGKVGFARATTPRKTRALITLILPVILDKVPDFYVPGRFDAELDALAQGPLPDAPLALAMTTSITTATPPAAAKATAAASTAAAAEPVSTPPMLKTPAVHLKGQCNTKAVATGWLTLLDMAIARNDAPAVLSLFALDAEVSGIVQGKDGVATTVQMGREEFAAGSLTALNSLTNYQQKRLSITATADTKTKPPQACNVVFVSSSVVEQGMQNGQPYRFKTLETYQLEFRNGRWLAVRAQTRQQ